MDVGDILGWVKVFMVEMGVYDIFRVSISVAIVVTLSSFLFRILRGA